MKLFYCILAYNDPMLLYRTVKRLSCENSSFFIHVQKSVDIRPFKEMLPNKYFVPDEERIETIWGDISCVQAAILLFKKCLSQGLCDLGGGYAILMSGADYPIKPTPYIYNYFIQKYPTNFFAFAEFGNLQGSFQKLVFSNRDNWWLSFERTKCKVEIKPFRYIRLRCIRKLQEIPVLQIIKAIPSIIFLFFHYKKFSSQYKYINWCTSETWMELSDVSVKKLVCWLDENPDILDSAKYCHNPEEMLLQSILNTIEKTVPRQNYLINCESRLIHKNRSLEILQDDLDFVMDKVREENWLFMRKFSSTRNASMLDKIDDELNKQEYKEVGDRDENNGSVLR